MGKPRYVVLVVDMARVWMRLASDICLMTSWFPAVLGRRGDGRKRLDGRESGGALLDPECTRSRHLNYTTSTLGE